MSGFLLLESRPTRTSCQSNLKKLLRRDQETIAPEELQTSGALALERFILQGRTFFLVFSKMKISLISAFSLLIFPSQSSSSSVVLLLQKKVFIFSKYFPRFLLLLQIFPSNFSYQTFLACVSEMSAVVRLSSSNLYLISKLLSHFLKPFADIQELHNELIYLYRSWPHTLNIKFQLGLVCQRMRNTCNSVSNPFYIHFTKIQNIEYKIQNIRYKMKNIEYKIQNTKYKIQYK